MTTIHYGSSTPTKVRQIISRQIQYNADNFDEIHVLYNKMFDSASVPSRSLMGRFNHFSWVKDLKPSKKTITGA